MLYIDQSHAWFRQSHCDPSSLINTNIFVSSDLAQQIMLMFDLLFGCSCSVCYRRDHKRFYCKAIPSSTAQVHPGERGSGNAVCAHFLTAGVCVCGDLLAVMAGKGHGSCQCCCSTWRGDTHIILLVSENELSVVMKFFRLNCLKLSQLITL